LSMAVLLSLILSAAGWALDEKPAQEKKVDQAELEKKELAALQGTWHLVTHERDGKEVPFEDIKTARLIIEKDKVTYKHGGDTLLEGKVEFDPTKNPKHLDFLFS